MWKRELHVLPKFLLEPIFIINKYNSNYFSFAKKHLIKSSCSDRDVYNLLDKTEPHLHFTKEEIIEGEKYLKKFGLGTNSKFVCLIVRDRAYLEHTSPLNNWLVAQTVAWSFAKAGSNELIPDVSLYLNIERSSRGS